MVWLPGQFFDHISAVYGSLNYPSPRESLQPHLKLVGPHYMNFILYIMTDDTEEHITKVIEDEDYWQDVRDFFNGGLRHMKRHPMWFLFDLDDAPEDFNPTFLPREINGYPDEKEEEEYKAFRLSCLQQHRMTCA